MALLVQGTAFAGWVQKLILALGMTETMFELTPGTVVVWVTGRSSPMRTPCPKHGAHKSAQISSFFIGYLPETKST
jgi:hypothetical protein